LMPMGATVDYRGDSPAFALGHTPSASRRDLAIGVMSCRRRRSAGAGPGRYCVCAPSEWSRHPLSLDTTAVDFAVGAFRVLALGNQ
jgi:hypothetical protein